MTTPTSSSAAERQRQWHALGMLCGLGLGLAPVAPQLCAVLRALVGADAAALFWLDAEGRPEGFFHFTMTPAPNFAGLRRSPIQQVYQ